MKPIQVKGKRVDFKFLRTLADHLENLKPPYIDVQEITIKKIHVDSGGHIQDYEAVVKGTSEAKLMGDGGKTCRHREDCTWDDMGLK